MPAISTVQLLIAWTFASGVVGFIAMWADKARAAGHQWRVPEKSFFALAFLGGFWGILAAEPVFHHKTRKVKFNLVVLAAAALWLFLLIRLGFFGFLQSSV